MDGSNFVLGRVRAAFGGIESYATRLMVVGCECSHCTFLLEDVFSDISSNSGCTIQTAGFAPSHAVLPKAVLGKSSIGEYLGLCRLEIVVPLAASTWRSSHRAKFGLLCERWFQTKHGSSEASLN